jgi:hypothetical protein
MADERAPREPRNLETRENETRDMSWEPASILPDPDPQDGWVFQMGKNINGWQLWITRMFLSVFVKVGNQFVPKITQNYKL